MKKDDKKKRNRVTTDKKRKKSHISGEYVQRHEAKDRWKHINERRY